MEDTRDRIGKLRWHAHHWLRTQGFTEVVLPTVWTRSEEYGVEEFSVQHSKKHPDTDLRLLQSPEFPLFTAMAGGVNNCYTFGRCFRFEETADVNDGNYLMEFEQLVFARNATTLEDMIELSTDLVASLASLAGVHVDPTDFVTLGPSGLAPTHRTNGLAIENLLQFTVPKTWTGTVRQQFQKRLLETGAQVYQLGRDTSTPERWAIEMAARHRDSVEAILRDVEATERHLDPTWNVYPPFLWRPDETTDSTYHIRSITSRRKVAADGTECIADAELYLSSKETIHIRSYADRGQFLENLDASGVPGLRERYAYLLPIMERAPTGIVGSFIGWERLVSALLDLPSAADALYFPRAGNGALRPCR